MRTHVLGHLTIDKVAELDSQPVDPTWLFPNLDPQVLAKYAYDLGPSFVREDKLILSFHSFVVRSKRRTILIDTCSGNHKPRTLSRTNMLAHDAYLNNLARIGLRPDDIDLVLCTHLHADHVGWNTRLVDGRWVPTFPNAKYVMSRTDFEFYDKLHKSNPERPVNHGSFADSVLPVVESGQAEIVNTDHVVERHVDDCVWLEPSPGHTPGHVCVHARSGGKECVVTGDVIHHPIQFRIPELVCVGDRDPIVAQQTRKALIDSVTDRDCLVLPAHFPSPTAGYVVSTPSGVGFRFSEG